MTDDGQVWFCRVLLKFISDETNRYKSELGVSGEVVDDPFGYASVPNNQSASSPGAMRPRCSPHDATKKRYSNEDDSGGYG